LVGLQLLTWVVGDPPVHGDEKNAGLPEAMLGAFAERPLPFAPHMVKAWNASGIGVVSVPAAEVLRLRERLAMAGPVRELQVPLSPRWLTGVSGSPMAGSSLVMLDSGPLRVEGGQPRLLVRAWATPGDAAPGAPMTHALAQLQVVPQLAGVALANPPARRTAAELLAGFPGLTTDAEAGQVLSRLTLDGACDGTDAYVFYPLLTAATPAKDDTSASTSRTIGPQTPEPPTLGEAMLSDALSPRPTRERTLFIIIPHPPAEFRLIE
jgi:hypothetical protein